MSTLDRPVAAALSSITLDVGEWYAAELALLGDDTLRIVFRERSGGDELRITVLPVGAPPPVFRRLRHCSLHYTARIARVTERRRLEIGALLETIGTSFDERLAGGGTLASVLGADRRPRRLVFGRETLRSLLAPELVEGVPTASGFVLHDIYPSSQRKLSQEDELSLIVEFRRDLRRLLFEVGRVSDAPALLRTRHFSIVEISGARGEVAGADGVRAMLSFVLQLRDHEGLEVVFPSVMADLGLRALPAPEAAPRESGSLNLALDSDCAQRCEFCSVKEVNPAYDGGDTALARALADLAASRDKGVHHLRLNGYDPLAFSRVLDVVDEARRLGFDEVDVFSPCTRLADLGFCRALMERLPARRAFHVPLYSTRPEVHDGFVGREGAHALVMQALDNLLALTSARDVRLLSVVTRTSLPELAGLHAFARSRGLAFSAHTPYPMQESRDDRFYEAVARQTDVAAVAAEIHGSTGEGRHDVLIHGVAPCVMHRAFLRRGVAPWRWLLAGEAAPLPGTEYDRTDIEHGAGERATGAYRASTVACVHRDRCVLVSACGGSLLRAYVERHGLEEFSPVDLRSLVEATGPG